MTAPSSSEEITTSLPALSRAFALTAITIPAEAPGMLVAGAPSSLPAARNFRRPVNPWLPPKGLLVNISCQAENYNDLTAQLLAWPNGETIPDDLLWEHPNMHGLPVKENGLPVLFEVCPFNSSIGRPS